MALVPWKTTVSHRRAQPAHRPGPRPRRQVVVEDPEERAQRAAASMPAARAPARRDADQLSRPRLLGFLSADRKIVLVASPRGGTRKSVLPRPAPRRASYDEEILVRHPGRGRMPFPGSALQGRDDSGRARSRPPREPARRSGWTRRLCRRSGEAVAAGVADPPLVDGVVPRGLRRATRRPWLWWARVLAGMDLDAAAAGAPARSWRCRDTRRAPGSGSRSVARRPGVDDVARVLALDVLPGKRPISGGPRGRRSRSSPVRHLVAIGQLRECSAQRQDTWG